MEVAEDLSKSPSPSGLSPSSAMHTKESIGLLRKRVQDDNDDNFGDGDGLIPFDQ
jgi:hypothetical protein